MTMSPVGDIRHLTYRTKTTIGAALTRCQYPRLLKLQFYSRSRSVPKPKHERSKCDSKNTDTDPCLTSLDENDRRRRSSHAQKLSERADGEFGHLQQATVRFVDVLL